MEAIRKELESRKSEIEKELELLFKANMKITDWDVPEADDKEAAQIIISIMKDKLDSIQSAVDAGEYDNY